MSEKSFEVVQVVAALFWRFSKVSHEKEVLIFQRAEHVSGAGFWEFPGGKIENNESLQSALMREIKEELNVRIKVQDFIAENIHQYNPGRKIHLSLYEVQALCPLHFDLSDHRDWAWVTLGKLKSWSLSAADIPLTEKLIDFLGKK